MMEQRPSLMQKLWKTARGPVYFVLFLWLLLLFDYLTGRHLGTLGVLPRRLSGLKGILFSPLIHGSAGHLFNNSIPLLISSMVIIHFYKKNLCAGHRSYLAVDGIFGVDICQTGLPHRRQWSGIWNGIFHFLDGTLQSGSSLNRFGTGDAFIVWANVHRHTSGQSEGFMVYS